MIRNIFYLVLLLVIAGLVYYLVKYRSTGTLDMTERSFAIEDTASIGKIYIADMQGRSIGLTRKGSQWMMDSKYPARKDATDLILATLRSVAVRYPVPDAARENVIKEMSSVNRKVQLFDLEGMPVKTIYIGHVPLDNIGNYMLIEGAKNPFVVEVPGFVGSLETQFITDTAEMRSRAVIAASFAGLAQISVRYTHQPDSSYVIDLAKSDSFKVYNPVTNVVLSKKEINKERLFDYIKFLQQVNCEAYENNNSVKPTILQQRPFCTITLKLRDGTLQTIDCYYKPVDRRSKAQTDNTGNPLVNDVDRFYGLVNGKDFVLLQYFHFGNLLRSFNYFKQ